MTQKLLVVEDDEKILTALHDLYARNGVQVVVAKDGEEALVKARTDRPDLILLDIMLPKMLGVSVLEKLKTQPETKQIPVVVLSNFGGYEEQCLQLGAAEFLLKVEVSLEQLRGILKKYLTKKDNY